MRYFGAHVSCAGGLVKAIANGEALGINTIQIHPSAPQRWITKDLPAEAVAEFVTAQKKTGQIKKVFAHGIYLANLANPDKQKFHLSKMSLVVYLNLMYEIEQQAKTQGSDMEVGGVVFHPGSAIHNESTEDGINQVAKGINWVMNQTKGSPLLLEMSAGAGKVIGDTMEELAAIREKVEHQDRVFYALDTQHMWASGYDWVTNLEGIVSDLDRILGLENIKLIHLNDSMTDLGSKRDRHEDLSEGKIGEAIQKVAQHPKLAPIPMVLETPCLKSTETALKDATLLREWVK